MLTTLLPRKTLNMKYLQRFIAFCKSLQNNNKNNNNIEKERPVRYVAKLEQTELISRMAAGVANEIRNPLTLISGYIQLLSLRDELSHLKNYLTAMEEAIKQTDCLIDDFLSIAQGKQVQLVMVDLNQVVLEVVPVLEAKARRINCQVKTDLAKDVPMLIDTKEIKQLVMIMAENGLEAMPKGGVLTIKTYVENGQAVLAICDEGEGIPPEVITKLGTPFLSTKEDGSGLGLAICQGIAARHEASIFFETGKQGTTFYIHFPLQIS